MLNIWGKIETRRWYGEQGYICSGWFRLGQEEEVVGSMVRDLCEDKRRRMGVEERGEEIES